MRTRWARCAARGITRGAVNAATVGNVGSHLFVAGNAWAVVAGVVTAGSSGWADNAGDSRIGVGTVGASRWAVDAWAICVDLVGADWAATLAVDIGINGVLADTLVADEIHLVGAARTPILTAGAALRTVHTLPTHIILPIIALQTLALNQKGILHTRTERVRIIHIVKAQRVGVAAVAARHVAEAPRRALIAEVCQIVKVIQFGVDLGEALADAVHHEVGCGAAAQDAVCVVYLRADAKVVEKRDCAESARAGGVVIGVCYENPVGTGVALVTAELGTAVAADGALLTSPMI